MKNYRDKTAVITGAASGIGLALARRAAREGMRLVLADIDGDALKQAALGLGPGAAEICLESTDVSREEDITALADIAYSRFGAVHLLCNNAGVGLTRFAWEMRKADWEWVLGVNLWGVIYAMQHFLPRMMAQEDASHMVNTASVAGLLSTPAMAAYNVSKHGVVTLSETLYTELAAQGAKVGVSVLCPAWVPTGIHESERHRPQRFGAAAIASANSNAHQERVAHAVKSGRLSADDMAAAVFEAVAEERFYIIPHERIKAAVKLRMEDILLARNPSPL